MPQSLLLLNVVGPLAGVEQLESEAGAGPGQMQGPSMGTALEKPVSEGPGEGDEGRGWEPALPPSGQARPACTEPHCYHSSIPSIPQSWGAPHIVARARPAHPPMRLPQGC